MIITDVPERLDELEGYAQSIHKLTGGDIYSFGLNLEDVPAIRDFVQNIDAGIEINYLINVAGINILKNFFSWELEEWEKVLRINATGTFFLTQVVVERMIVQKKKGNIVFVSSQHGVVANHDRIPYCLSKGMLIQLTKALALELAPHDIRVNCVSPTFVLTERNQSFLYNSYFQKEALEQIPLNKYALPVDVANG
ncbi:SDR family NAD(P)-dependent oxidoreductase, partial [Caldalkalibacillus mannanilyticus]|uniref:SDR family NAD(P)-dependent oxidoreductase n=1 Tax=Caldalkalibacillus mannanilyticus TaxID=1418 RepID=UPI0004686E39